MTGVVDKVSRVRDILEDDGIDKITECDQRLVTDRRKLWMALEDGTINMKILVDSFADMASTLFKINEAVNE